MNENYFSTIKLLAMLSLLLGACTSSFISEQTGNQTAISIFPAVGSEINVDGAAVSMLTESPITVLDQLAEAQPDETLQPFGDLYLFSPLRSTETYLMNAEGQAVYIWPSDYSPGHSVYLLENGNLLRTGSLRSSVFDAGGAGGIVQEIAPDGNIVWEFEYANNQMLLHHDIEQMPNGNVLMIAWEMKTEAEAIAAGRDPSLLSDGELWPDHIIEVDPASNQIVWEWHVWDHLVQDYDSNLPNFAVIADHPELIDLNFTLRQAGADWTHINSIDYNADLDQILLSVHAFSEIWIIDHSISAEEAAGPAGDLLYRWGNPQSHNAGNANDQQLFVQHDAQWIAAGLPGEGNILIFNNGDQRSRPYSSIEEISPPLNTDGTYSISLSEAFDPLEPLWSYVADASTDFFADRISGAQRLPNGNTLICSGPDGYFFEVTPTGEIVWVYTFGGSTFRLTQIAENDPALASLELSLGDFLEGTAQGSGPGQNPGANNPQ